MSKRRRPTDKGSIEVDSEQETATEFPIDVSVQYKHNMYLVELICMSLLRQLCRYLKMRTVSQRRVSTLTSPVSWILSQRRYVSLTVYLIIVVLCSQEREGEDEGGEGEGEGGEKGEDSAQDSEEERAKVQLAKSWVEAEETDTSDEEVCGNEG